MARSRSSSSTWRYINPAYYLKRPKRLALLLIVFVSATLVFWDRQTLVREHEVHLHICFRFFIFFTRLKLEKSRLNFVLLLLVWMENDLHISNNFACKFFPPSFCCLLFSIYAVVDHTWNLEFLSRLITFYLLKLRND